MMDDEYLTLINAAAALDDKYAAAGVAKPYLSTTVFAGTRTKDDPATRRYLDRVAMARAKAKRAKEAR